MATDSSQSGYLQPQNTNSVLEDVALTTFLQGLVVGITGLPGKRVFQRWQSEPPVPPDFGIDWSAIGEQGNRKRDTFAYITHRNNEDVVYRQEILPILASFYGPNARANAELLAMGFQIDQNRDAMRSQGYGLVGVEDSIITSDLQHERWVPRVDLPFRVRRAVTYSYPVLDMLGAQITLNQRISDITLTLPMFAWGPEGTFVAGWGSGNWTELK